MVTGPAKKPIKVITTLVIVAMLLSMADAASAHRTRHKSCLGRLEPSRHAPNRTRPREVAKELQRLQLLVKRALNQLQSIRSTEAPASGSKPPRWLPRVNFREISRRNNVRAIERFELLVPKLYRQMKNYTVLFECLDRVAVNNIDTSDPEDRSSDINHVLDVIGPINFEANISLSLFNRCKPRVLTTCGDLVKQGFSMKPDHGGRLVQDTQAVKGLKRALQNWTRAFCCGQPMLRDNKICKPWRRSFGKRKPCAPN